MGALANRETLSTSSLEVRSSNCQCCGDLADKTLEFSRPAGSDLSFARLPAVDLCPYPNGPHLDPHGEHLCPLERRALPLSSEKGSEFDTDSLGLVRQVMDDSTWEIVKPTPLHTPPASPTSRPKELLQPSSSKFDHPSDEEVWHAPRWAPRQVRVAPQVQPSLPLEKIGTSSLDEWRAPRWSQETGEMFGAADGAWKAPKWSGRARSASPARVKPREKSSSAKCVPSILLLPSFGPH